MVKTKFLIRFILIPVLIGTLISQASFIPTWETAQTISVVVVYGFTGVMCSIHLFKRWKNDFRRKEKLKAKNWILTTLVSVGLLIAIAALFLFSVLSTRLGFFDASWVKTYKFKNLTVYQYENGCFPPDNDCECHDYYSLVYFKYPYLPLMHQKAKVDFYIESIKISSSHVTIKASGRCPKDIHKVVVIDF